MEQIATSLIHDAYYKLDDKFIWAYFNENLNGEEFYTLVVYAKTEHQDKGFTISLDNVKTILQHFADKKPLIGLQEHDATLSIGYSQNEDLCAVTYMSPDYKSPLVFNFTKTQISYLLEIYVNSKQQIEKNKEMLERLRQVRVEIGLQEY